MLLKSCKASAVKIEDFKCACEDLNPSCLLKPKVLKAYLWFYAVKPMRLLAKTT